MHFFLRVIAPLVIGGLGSLACVHSATTPSPDASRTCIQLQSRLGTEIVQSSGPTFLASATNAWSLFNTVQRPSCVVFPTNASHVQAAMKAIYRDNVRYAVQAGSHTAMTGWNNVQGGVLITFSNMTSVSYNATKDTITLEPGVHWGDAVAAVEQFGVAPMGGRITGVGTGLLLGGGLSYLAAEHGWSADSFREVDVVLVTGKLVTATATNKYADLFRALKGGANRFGIVTRYEVAAIHTGTNADKNWFGGIIMYPNSSAEAVITATANYVRNVDDPRAGMLVALINTAFEGVLTTSHIVTLFFRGTELPASIFGEFLSIPASVSLIGPSSYAEAASSLGSGDARGFGQLFGASAFNGGVDQYMDAWGHFNNYTQTFKDSFNATVLAFTPIHKSQILASRASGGNVMNPPLGSYAAVQVQTQFAPGLLAIPPELERGRQLLFSQIPRSPGLPLYINECDASQNVFATYGDFEFLKSTYAKYDPTRFNVRNTQGPIGL